MCYDNQVKLYSTAITASAATCDNPALTHCDLRWIAVNCGGSRTTASHLQITQSMNEPLAFRLPFQIISVSISFHCCFHQTTSCCTFAIYTYICFWAFCNVWTCQFEFQCLVYSLYEIIFSQSSNCKNVVVINRLLICAKAIAIDFKKTPEVWGKIQVGSYFCWRVDAKYTHILKFVKLFVCHIYFENVCQAMT